MRRVNTALRQVLAEAVGRELADPRLGFVTITAVEAARDLRTARVYYTVLADPGRRGRRAPDPRQRREDSQQALESARGLLQGRVGSALRTRHTPQLDFRYDEHVERAVSLTRLIDEVAPAGPETPEPSGQPPTGPASPP
jgi:ribosome-binding factor A